MHLILCDGIERDHLLPLTHLKPVAHLRLGIFTLAEKWEKRFKAVVSVETQPHLSALFTRSVANQGMRVNGALLPTEAVFNQLMALKHQEQLQHNGRWLAGEADAPEIVEAVGEVKLIDRPWRIFQWNDWAIREDLQWLRSVTDWAPVPAGVVHTGADLYIEHGATVAPCFINTTTGPVYLAAGSEVMEGAMIRGSLALCAGAQLKMGAKVYGGTTIGPECRVGGEVNNSVFMAYSNKGHDGFVGNSVVGEWCNLGADTNTSNLKNTYGDVKVYNYALGRTENTGSQFCGLTMGDHAKCSINTMFNTGTVCGAFANVFGADFHNRRIRDFAWGGGEEWKKTKLADAIDTATRMMARRNIEFTDELRAAVEHLYNSAE